MRKLALVLAFAAVSIASGAQGVIHGNGDPSTTKPNCAQSRFYVDDSTAKLYIAASGSPCVWTDASNLVSTAALPGCAAGSTQYPCLVATVSATAQTADIGTTTAYAVPAGAGGQYLMTCYDVVMVASTTGTLPACSVLFTDANSNNQGTGVQQISGSNSGCGPVLGCSSLNNTATVQTGTSVVINAKASTNIQYNTSGYASTGTPMQYAVHLKAVYLGPN